MSKRRASSLYANLISFKLHEFFMEHKGMLIFEFDFLKSATFFQWQALEMTQGERRKVLCSVSFHIIAITCIVWSLWVLIEKTAEEIKDERLKWPFWTKLVVVAIGFAGGLVFMYVQCRVYLHLFKRLKAHNRVICVKNAPADARNINKLGEATEVI